MITIKELATVFGGVIAEYVACPDFDEKQEPDSELLRDLIKALQNRQLLSDEQIDYSCSPVLYRGIKWDTVAFNRACAEGHLEFVKWLYTSVYGHIDVEQIYMEASDSIITMDRYRCMIGKTIQNGHHLVIEWLNTIWPELIKRLMMIHFVIEAAANGHIDMVKLAHSICPHACTLQHSRIMTYACANGHIEIAKWLREQQPDFNGDMCDAFEDACENGHLEVLKWIKAEWPNVRYDSRAFSWLCDGGYLEAAQWLEQTGPSIANDIYDYAYHSAHKKGHTHIVEWLHSKWPDRY